MGLGALLMASQAAWAAVDFESHAFASLEHQRRTLKHSLEAFFKVHNPAAVGKIDVALDTFKGRETMLLEKMKSKYGEAVVIKDIYASEYGAVVETPNVEAKVDAETASKSGNGKKEKRERVIQAPSDRRFAALQIPPNKASLGIHIQINPTSGWGNFALNIFDEFDKNDLGFYPLMTQVPNGRVDDFEFKQKEMYKRLFEEQRQAFGRPAHEYFGVGHRKNEKPVDFPVLHAVPADFDDEAEKMPIWSSVKNAGVCFFERGKLEERLLKNAEAFDLILAGSEWNTRTLRSYGLKNVHTILQGVDVDLFKPHEGSAPYEFQDAAALYGKDLRAASAVDLQGKWILFSGGKLEIVAAFKKFLKMHDDVVLVTAWHNQWEYIMKSIQGPGFVKGFPKTKGGRIYFTEWLEENDIPSDRAYHLDETNQATVASLLKRADAAIFTNRGEGGTNLVAMEAMASGVPTVISNNTGHVDIISEEWCYPLTKQSPINEPGAEGWGESAVDEIVFTLEGIYEDREEAREIGLKGAGFIRSKYTWPKAIAHLSTLLLESGF